MESIIARQTVARRRTSRSAPSPDREAKTSFFESLGARNEGAPRQSDRPSPRQHGPKPRPTLGLDHQKPARRARKPKEPRGPGPIQRLLAALSHLKTARRADTLPVQTRLVPDAARPRLPAIRLPRLFPDGLKLPAIDLDALGRKPLILAAAGLLALGLMALVIVLALPPRFPMPEGELLPAAGLSGAELDSILLDYLSPDSPPEGEPTDLASIPLPRILSVANYTIVSGDSISSIAKKFGRRADTIISFNGIKNQRAVVRGAVLGIPNMDGVVHVVSRGESLSRIAKNYKVDMTLLADANDLGSAGLHVGQRLFVPGARMPETALRQVYGTTVAWPLRGPISSRFGVRGDPFTGVRRFHSGLDIVVNIGTPVKAAVSGKIVDLGYNANYGNYIIQSSGEGIQVLYGHLSAFSATLGQTVSQGSLIAKSGNTGYSTGPHLHLGIYRQGVAIDPLKYLK